MFIDTIDCVLRINQTYYLKNKFQAIKNPAQMSGVSCIGCLAVSYSRMANATLPSALQRFTSEFGMGSGGSTALLPPGKIFNLRKLM